jgi:Uma2 family endonuclease
LERDDLPRRSELLCGEVIVNEPTVLHQHACLTVASALRVWVDGPNGRGTASLPLDLVLEEDVVLAPDALWFAEPIALDSIRAPRPPELAVEVRSPSTWAHDVGRKRELYERHGVRELWLIDTTSKSVLRFARSTASSARFDIEEELEAKQTLKTSLLPGFSLAVERLFSV